MKKPLVYVGQSRIHGKGLFAARKIKAGQLIGTVNGKPTATDGPYVLWLSDREGFKVKCDLRFINHSPTPNACYYDSLEVCALKTIKPGEEITHNYDSA